MGPRIEGNVRKPSDREKAHPAGDPHADLEEQGHHRLIDRHRLLRAVFSKERGSNRWSVSFVLLLALVAVLVFGPVLIMVVRTFQEQPFGQEVVWGLQSWVDALSSRRLGSAIWNTLSLSLTRQLIAMIVGVWLAWLIARTDLPCRKLLEYGFWMAVFIPGLTITLAWILLLDPFYGLLNRWAVALPFFDEGPFNIYSWGGIVWVNLLTSALPIKVMLLVPAFNNLDAALEEASRTTGATNLQTFRRVILPLLAPAMLVAFVLGTIRSLESFEIELILGLPAGIEVLSTNLYRLARSSPPMYSQATVVAMVSLSMMVPAVIFQRQYSARRSYATLTGKSTAARRSLGVWRWPIFAVVAFMVGIMTVFPMILVVVGTFMRFFGRFNLDQVWTTDHWSRVLSSPMLASAFKNSLILSFGTALVAVTFFSLLAYLIVRTQLRGRALLDYMVWIPSMLPGIVIGLGYLVLFLTLPPLRPLYGTMYILIIVTALGAITLTTQMVKANLTQLGSELEEAARGAGGSWFFAYRTIVLPLIAPTLAVVAVLAFSSAARTTGHVALLSTRTNQPLSILQLNQMADMQFEAASVVGVFLLFMTAGVGLVARFIGSKTRGLE